MLSTKLFREAADQGKANAQYKLGNLYWLGVGVPQDFAEAVIWYRLAADQGLAVAQYRLGAMYDHGQGVSRDYAEAAKWYQLSSRPG